MELKDIIKIADDAYGDGLIQQYAEDRNGQHGDNQARFIAIELEETFDEASTEVEQLAAALQAMDNARGEIGLVCEALADKLRDLGHSLLAEDIIASGPERARIRADVARENSEPESHG